MFEQSLNSLIKGVRAHPGDEAAYIANCLGEIREELASTVATVKAQAVEKLTYLHMLGYDVAWASFHFVDVMSFSQFGHKRVGSLAIAQSFSAETDVALLTTNLFRKAFASSCVEEVCVALGTLARIASADLAADLVADVCALTASSRPHVRARAVLTLYRLLHALPEALDTAFPRIADRLVDDCPTVVAAAVNVLAEFIAANPQGYLGLAPQLYRLITSGTSSNWTLIKARPVLKCLRSLMPHEPRLAKKLVRPISDLARSSRATSVTLECLDAIADCMAGEAEAAATATALLEGFLRSDDPNLKFLALGSLANLHAASPGCVATCYELVVGCLGEECDLSVRSAALPLATSLASREKFAPLVGLLVRQLDAPLEPEYRSRVVSLILHACRADGFVRVPSFKWLVATLLALGRTHSANDDAVAACLIEVSCRVPAIRRFAAERSLALLLAVTVPADAAASSPPPPMLSAAAWVLGEHGGALPKASLAASALALVAPGLVALAPSVQASAIQAALRVYVLLAFPPVRGARDHSAGSDNSGSAGAGDAYAYWPTATGSGGVGGGGVSGGGGEVDGGGGGVGEGGVGEGGVGGGEGVDVHALAVALVSRLAFWCGSPDSEVRERALCSHAVLSLVAQCEQARGEPRRRGGVELGEGHASAAAYVASLAAALAQTAVPVAPNAQRLVRPPADLRLDARIHPLEEEEPRAGRRLGGVAAQTPSKSASRRCRSHPDSPYYLPYLPAPESAGARAPSPRTRLSLGASSAAPAAGSGRGGSGHDWCANSRVDEWAAERGASPRCPLDAPSGPSAESPSAESPASEKGPSEGALLHGAWAAPVELPAAWAEKEEVLLGELLPPGAAYAASAPAAKRVAPLLPSLLGAESTPWVAGRGCPPASPASLRPSVERSGGGTPTSGEGGKRRRSRRRPEAAVDERALGAHGAGDGRI